MRIFSTLILASLLIGCGTDFVEPTDSADPFVDDTAIIVDTGEPAEPCFVDIGTPACDFTLLDQFENEVSLSDFEGSPIILDFSAMWCGPCNVAARDLQFTQDLYAEHGLVYVTVLLEDYNGLDPDSDDTYVWSSLYGISAPVLAGDIDMVEYYGGSWPLNSWPTFYYINKDFEVEYYHGGYSLAVIDNNIQVLLGL